MKFFSAYKNFETKIYCYLLSQRHTNTQMSSSIIEYFTFVSRSVTIYFGIPVLVAGFIGNIFNLIVFLSLNTFRQNSCAFYLTVLSAVNNGQLITGLLSRIMISGFDIDWTQSSVFYCKCRAYLFQFCALTSFVCTCLATIDQFLATCSSPRWQHWASIKVAHRVTLVLIFVWIVHGIPYWIYYNIIKSNTDSTLICMSSNPIFQRYHVDVFSLVLTGFLPIFINVLFGFLAYHNLQQLAWRVLPVVQREVDKQLTAMVLIQVVYHSIVTMPYLIVTILNKNTLLVQDSLVNAKLQFANILTLYIYYLNYAVS
jgi:hypothetical protein